VILYELLSGARPYDVGGGGLRETAQVVRATPPRPLAEAWPPGTVCDPRLETIVARALEKRPADRYQTVLAVIEDIDRLLGHEDRPKERRSHFLSRKRALVLGVTVLVVYGALVTGLFLRERSIRTADPETGITSEETP
jgi:serine/threonine-protein kinase